MVVVYVWADIYHYSGLNAVDVKAVSQGSTQQLLSGGNPTSRYVLCRSPNGWWAFDVMCFCCLSLTTRCVRSPTLAEPAVAQPTPAESASAQ
jgi:hypothetical protein